MRQTVMTVITIVVLIYAGLCAFLYASQRSAMYYPTPEVQHPDVADIRLASDGETLKIWSLANTGASHAIIYFGGNAEDVSANIPDFITLFPHYAVFLVNYRGYGGSTGLPTETGLYKDALAVFDELHTRYPKISVIGRSLGSAVASYLSSRRDVEKLALVTPFDSIENVVRKAYPAFPVSLLLKDKFNAIGHVAEIVAPVLVIIAGDDEVIPRGRSDAIAQAFARSKVTVEVIAGAGHNSIGMYPGYAFALVNFFATESR